MSAEYGAVNCRAGDAEFKMLSAGGDDGVVTRFIENGFFEKYSMELWVEAAKEAYSIVDVGAHTGAYTLAAMAVTPGAVYSYEPYFMNFARLSLNLRLNNENANNAHMCGIGADRGMLPFACNPNHGYLWSGGTFASNGRGTPLPIEPLDAIHERIHLVKIDVEGFEGEVIKGMQRIIANCKPTIFFECIDEEAGRAVQDGLTGYEFFEINDELSTLTKVDEVIPSRNPDGAPNMNIINRLAKPCK